MQVMKRGTLVKDIKRSYYNTKLRESKTDYGIKTSNQEEQKKIDESKKQINKS